VDPMTVYLEFHPDQVQKYLTRWSDLKGRRGASTMLRHATSDEVITPLIPPGASINDSAPKVDGVVSLIVNDVDQAEAVEARILSHLRNQCPSATFHTAVAEVDSHSPEQYLAAWRNVIEPKVINGLSTVALPSPNELPTAKRCRLTGRDICIGARIVSSQEPHLMGADAFARVRSADWRNSRHEESLSALELEDRLALKVDFRKDQIADAEVRDFNALAALGPPDQKQNHLATIFIDGNNIGELVEDHTGGELVALSKRLADATWEALAVATHKVCEITDQGPDGSRGQQLPVIPHIVGGDDVLVTVPAFTATAFTRSYLEVFAAAMAGFQFADGSAVSASGGVVVHHAKFPFTQVAPIAADTLKAAKAANQGNEAALLLVETTREVVNDPHIDDVWPLTEFVQPQLLDGIALLPKSTRAALEGALSDWRESRTRDKSSPASGDVAWLAAARTMAILDRAPAGDLPAIARASFKYFDQQFKKLRQHPAGSSNPEPELRRLSKTLQITRWWS